MPQITNTAFTKTEKAILFGIGLLLFAFIIARAICVPMIGDELGTFYWYIQQGEFLPYKAHWDANNHLVNSVLGIVFYNLFGSAEWSLRLGNVIFFPLYLFYSYKLACLLNSKVLRWGLIFTLWFAHNFIEFFAYSRGYGMSMGLLIATLYFIARFIQQPGVKLLLWALFFNTFAFTANLSLLNTFLLINLALLLVSAINYKKLNLWQSLAGFVIISGIPANYFVRYLFEMKKRGLLYYGSTDGFVNVTLNTLADLILGASNSILVYGIIGLFFVLLLVYAVHKRSNLTTIALVDLFTALLTGNVVIIFILALVMHVNYPEDRVGLYLFPLFVLMGFFIVDVLKPQYRYVLLVSFLYMPVHFVMAANITYSKQWYEDHIPRRYFDTVLEASKGNEFPPIVSGYKMRTLTWAYYNMRRGTIQNQIQETNFKKNTLSDFIITKRNEVVGIEQHYNEIDTDPISGLVLYKRNTKLKCALMFENTLPDMPNTTAEFIGFTDIVGDSLPGKSYLLNLGCNVKCLGNYTPDARICVDLLDKNGKSVGYNYQQLDWLYGKGNGGEYTVKQSFVIPPIAANVTKVVIYYWSISKRPVNFTNGQYKIYKVQ